MSGTPNVLLFDLETLPNVGYFWGLKIPSKYLSYENIVRERSILCAAWKWLDVPKIHSVAASLDLSQRFPDLNVLKRLAGLVEKADMVIAHNGEFFDMPWLRTRMRMAKLTPLAPVLEMDTRAELKRQRYNFNSLKLDYVAEKLGVGQKIDVDFDLWKECMPDGGNTITNRRAALKEMMRYNRHDVRLLEGVYKELRSGLTPKLNLALFSEEPSKTCPHCQREGTLLSHGRRFTRSRVWIRYRCHHPKCGGWCYRPPGSPIPR
ncbi:MAG TPA: ribonuclease H-like domain-containing protein [Planctomycetota bacterium]|nr:ribonuclease H-like domain-containing protein [Planctomycetota bacterium]